MISVALMLWGGVASAQATDADAGYDEQTYDAVAVAQPVNDARIGRILAGHRVPARAAGVAGTIEPAGEGGIVGRGRRAR